MTLITGRDTEYDTNLNFRAADTMREILLDSSHDEIVKVELPEKTDAAKLFKVAASFTTLTTTAYTENTATTVSVSFHCIAPNGINYEFC